MKVGFLSIDASYVDRREAQIALFDNGHTAGPFLTVPASDVEWALAQLRTVCDAIVIEGNKTALYDTYKDTLAGRPDYFEQDGKLHCVTNAATPEYINQKVMPQLGKKNKRRYGVIVFKTYGKTESELRTILKDFNKKSKIQLGFFPDFAECEVHARCSSNMAKEEMNEISARLNELLYSFTYSYERISIAECVAQMLKEDGLKLKIAESFTGGAIAREFTSLPGASEYLVEGLVTYSVASKHKRLGVKLETIAEKGVVSGDTVYSMAHGLMSSGDCDIAVATTGNAGPTAQSGPVGLCFVAIGITAISRIAVVRYSFDGDRDENIRLGVKKVLFLMYESIRSFRAQKKAAQAQAAQMQAAQAQQQATFAATVNPNNQAN